MSPNVFNLTVSVLSDDNAIHLDLMIAPDKKHFLLTCQSDESLSDLDVEKMLYEVAHQLSIKVNNEHELKGDKELWN